MILRRSLTALLLGISLLAGCSSGGADAEAGGSAPAITEQPRWADRFVEFGVEGTFVLQRLDDLGEVMVHDRDRAEQRVIPASTFKILNSLVALEAGAVDDVDSVIPWDGVDRGITSWNEDQTLRSAIEVSAVWAYQELARRVGEEQMTMFVSDSDYGNADIGGPIDEFWLRGDLRISPLEQIDIVGRLLRDELPFQAEHQAAVREILVRERGDDWVFAHKTGTALSAEPVLGWLVGYTENADERWAFALNLDLPDGIGLDSQIDPNTRQDLSRRILVDEGALPETALHPR